MAAPSRRSPAALIASLFAEPSRFEFFQAVRLLERAAGTMADTEGGEHLDGLVRFCAALPLGFPLGEIDVLRPGSDGQPAEMRVSFLGLDGPSGVLPRHYSELVLQQVRQKSLALRDFLDIFNHRAVAMHFLAWRKYRLAPAVEAARGTGGDPITEALYALVGLATPGLRQRLAVEDETFLYYAGLFAQPNRSAAGLEAILSDYLGQSATIVQFAGRWAPLAIEDQTRLAGSGSSSGKFAQLGVNAVAGRRVWDVQSGFLIRLGPLDLRQFSALMPGSPLMNEIAALARSYTGPTLAFDIELALRGDAVPACQLAGSGAFLPRLGWNTWLAAPSFPALVSDAVMHFTGI